MADVAFEALLERHRAFWNRDPVDAPLLNTALARETSVSAPLEGIALPLADGTILSEQGAAVTPDQFDPKLILDAEEFPRYTGAANGDGPLIVDDLLVTRAPLGKFPWVEAVLGCPVVPRLDTGSIYSAPHLDSPANIASIPAPEQSPWREFLLNYARALADDSAGRYQVVQCLQRGPIDLASALLGHTEMCYAVYDEPENIARLNEYTTRVFLDVAKAQQALAPPLNGGYTCPFGVWAPGTVVKTQCDVASSVRADMYEEMFFPYDVQICEQFDYSVVHLHSGYLHHMDVFLKGKYPTAVQVSLDTGSTPWTVHDLIPIFARVLEVKPLFIQGVMSKAELDEMLERLPYRGLYISAASRQIRD